MNQRLFSMLVAILLLSGATNVREQYPDTFFTDGDTSQSVVLPVRSPR